MWLLGLLLLVPAATAQEEDGGLVAPSAWDLQFGDHAAELPTGEFANFACGTAGGPPSLPLDSWTSYDRCPPEADTGLHEVYFEYDNELELWAKAHGLETMAALHEYTSAYQIPIIASVLFDDRGFMVGLRIVSDPRVPEDIRQRGVTLGGFLMARYGVDEWTCADLELVEGEQPYRGRFEKRRCEMTAEDLGQHLVLETHNYRKPGQFAVDPITNRPTQGYFRSDTILEALLIDEIDDADARLAAIAERADQPTEQEVLVATAMDCPGCDFAGADFKRADLSGANLAGADLSGANLHEAILRGADLTGANLDDANLNGADVKLADLSGATLRGAMMYLAAFDGANLTAADLSDGLAGHASMPVANLSDAIMVGMDLRNARINDANLSGADIRATWLDDAQMMRSDFTGALFTQSVMQRVNLTGAILVNASLRGADLIRANLREADLTAADFSFARLTFALLQNTITVDAVWTEAELPRGFDPD